MPEISERGAERIFAQAMVEGRCAELLQALFDGGSATVNAKGTLVIVSAETLKMFSGGATP